MHGVRSNGTKKKMCTCAQLAGKWYPVPGSAYLSTWYLVPGTWYDLRAHSIAYIVIFLFVWCTICSSPFRIQYVLYVLRICLSIFIITDQCPLVDAVSFLYNVARMSTDSSMGKSLGARIPTYSVMGKYLGYSAQHIPVQ